MLLFQCSKLHIFAVVTTPDTAANLANLWLSCLDCADRCQAFQDFTGEREGRPHILHLHGKEQQESIRSEE